MMLPKIICLGLSAFYGEVVRQYNIRGILVIFLIDPEVWIVTNQLRGDAMARYMDLLLNKGN